MTDTGPLDALTPLQRRTLEALRRSADPIVFDAELVAELEHDIETAFDGFAARLGEDELFVSKHALTSVLGCEVQHLHPDPFEWSPALASGQVAHRAIQLMVHWRGEVVPADVVDDALARLSDDDTTLGDWIAGLAAADEADLRGLAVERVTKFSECFPPLDKRATPMTEARVQWPLAGPILLSGKVDLVLGRTVGTESRKVIIDLKTGRPAHRHREDLRFYALVETLRTGVPPRKLASFYLDVGQPVIEDVTPAVLRTAVRRTLDGVNALIELTVERRTPVKRAGITCRWCPLNLTCAEGLAYLERGDRDVDP
ncbi:MAG TPA: PD-(D/E)XK nuclease family protein [Ilumatobacteraceae bacterium]|nr:PD-(D/E)XK nuclease family protein [Ilumatobacteraceae bacterium]